MARITPLARFFHSYISCEEMILKAVRAVSHPFCSICRTKCCKENMCRESVESIFLSRLIKRQHIAYDPKNGWMSVHECRLSFGRPPVCYEFFCEPILRSNHFKASNIQQGIKEFISIGNRALGNTHLICVDHLQLISSKKILQMNDRIDQLMVNLTDRMPDLYDVKLF